MEVMVTTPGDRHNDNDEDSGGQQIEVARFEGSSGISDSRR
jgi:hypothetical protein